MDTVNTILVKLRLRKPQPQLTREQAMEARPVRNPALAWKVNDNDNIVVTLTRRSDMAGKALGWLFMVPEHRTITLDDVGTMVWQYCDGQNTVSDIVSKLSKHLKVTQRETEVSLTEYLRTLGQRGMIGFMVERDVAEATGAAGQDVVGLEDVAKTKDEYEQVRKKTEEEIAETQRILKEMEQAEQDETDETVDVADDDGASDDERAADDGDEDDEWDEGDSLVENVDDY